MTQPFMCVTREQQGYNTNERTILLHENKRTTRERMLPRRLAFGKFNTTNTKRGRGKPQNKNRGDKKEGKNKRKKRKVTHSR